MYRLAAAFLFSALFLFAAPAHVSGHCTFDRGFKALRDLIGHHVVGDCLENEHYNAIGDSNQQTTRGLMVWRKLDNHTVFTDGYHTWIRTGNGFAVRLNTDRFEWENDPPEPTPTPTPYIDPQLGQAFKIIRSTESGEKVYQWFVQSGASARFHETKWHGGVFFGKTNSIYINPNHRNDPPSAAAWLVHETIHAALPDTGHESAEACYEEETIAFQWQAQFWLDLYGEHGNGKNDFQSRFMNANVRRYLQGAIGDLVRGDEAYQEQCSKYPSGSTLAPAPAPQPTPKPVATLIQRSGCTYDAVYWGLVERAGGGGLAQGMFKRGGIPVLIEMSTEVERVFRGWDMEYPEYKGETTTFSLDFCEQFVISGDYQNAVWDIIWPDLSDEWKDYINEMYVEARAKSLEF